MLQTITHHSSKDAQKQLLYSIKLIIKGLYSSIWVISINKKDRCVQPALHDSDEI